MKIPCFFSKLFIIQLIKHFEMIDLPQAQPIMKQVQTVHTKLSGFSVPHFEA